MKTVHRETSRAALALARRVMFAACAFAVACMAPGALIQYWPAH
jgi:hypothetical protein